jgi:ferredoxin-thioredoxin reductase catalytic chain
MFSIKATILLTGPLILGSVTHAFSPSSPLTHASMRIVTDKSRGHTTCFESKDDMSDEEREIAMEKALKAMTAFSNKYTENTGTFYCSDPSVPAVVIKGLAEHKVTLGSPLCPCRFYDDKEKEAKEGYWNCPCVPMRERHECHCMLFLTEDNDFAGDQQVRSSMCSSQHFCTLFHSNVSLLLISPLRTFPSRKYKNHVGGLWGEMFLIR